MNVRSYYQCLVFINTQELPRLPPFGGGQAFDDNEIKEILLFSTPPEWHREMDQMGFDPSHHDSMGILHFMENIEAAENAIPAGTEARGLLTRFSAFTHGFGRHNPNP